jgi:hypothetical protein
MSEIAAFAPSGAAFHWMMSHVWRTRSREPRRHGDSDGAALARARAT